MINYPYHLARLEGRITRDVYRRALPLITRRIIKPVRKIDIDVFAYSGEQTLPEQVASIRSFLRYAGRPNRFTVVSDGSYAPQSIKLIETIDQVVKVAPATPVSPHLPETIRAYLTNHPMGKQLAVIMSLPADRPALYIDSDVLFFPSASDLADRAAARGFPACYLADCHFAGDERLIRDPLEGKDPVNAGCILLHRKLDWNLGLERLLQLKGSPNFFTTQTIVHLTMHLNGAGPLDPRKYVLQVDDQFGYRDFYAGKSLAMRHYVNPVRHKFWTYFAR